MIIHELWIIWTFLGLFQVFSPIFKCFEMIGLPLRTKLQIKGVDSVTKIIKSHQKVSLRTILHVNIIIKSLRTSAIGYFLTIITIWPIESRKKRSRDSKNEHLISLSSCDVEWSSRDLHVELIIRFQSRFSKFIHLNRISLVLKILKSLVLEHFKSNHIFISGWTKVNGHASIRVVRLAGQSNIDHRYSWTGISFLVIVQFSPRCPVRS